MTYGSTLSWGRCWTNRASTSYVGATPLPDATATRETRGGPGPGHEPTGTGPRDQERTIWSDSSCRTPS
jgi:hypothetical protein